MLPRATTPIAQRALFSRAPGRPAFQQLQRSQTQFQLQRRRRYNTTQQHKPPSATGDFYKTFTRPVAKCLLLALLTYQILYWGWLKLEQDEIMAERQAEISELEAQVESLQAAAEEKAKQASGGQGQEGGEERKKGRWWWPL